MGLDQLVSVTVKNASACVGVSMALGLILLTVGGRNPAGQAFGGQSASEILTVPVLYEQEDQAVQGIQDWDGEDL